MRKPIITEATIGTIVGIDIIIGIHTTGTITGIIIGARIAVIMTGITIGARITAPIIIPTGTHIIGDTPGRNNKSRDRKLARVAGFSINNSTQI